MNWFVGSKFKVWWNFVKRNPKVFLPRNWLKIVLTSIITFRNSLLSKKEEKKLSNINFTDIKLKDPIFILGHWRSGTSHLHNILINDHNFNYPTLLQVTFPNTCLLTQEKIKQKENQISNKRPMDNMVINPKSPGEEEVAVWSLGGVSSIGNRLLKNREIYYDRFLTFENATKEELKIWESNFIYFLKKISMNDNRKLLLKSPEHTARIRLLLNIFPNAKFINIHRHPIDVFKSTKNLYEKVFKPSYYEKVEESHLTERMIKIYKKMYDSYFNDVKLIPKENFVDISYEELNKIPMGTVEKIYNELKLGLQNENKIRIQNYINSLSNYSKNSYKELNNNMIERIYSEWEKSFNFWGYEIKKNVS